MYLIMQNSHSLKETFDSGFASALSQFVISKKDKISLAVRGAK